MEYELDRSVEKWGWRWLRKGREEEFVEKWRERERCGGCYEGGWVGRILRGVRKHKLEGERWEVEREREGKGNWELIVRKYKKEAKEKREWGRMKREREWIVVVSNGGGEGKGMRIEGGWWEEGDLKNSWGLNGGRGLTVMMGDLCAVKEGLERVEREYVGMKKNVVVGVDNVGVLKWLRKGGGICGEVEQGVRRVAMRMLRKGW